MSPSFFTIPNSPEPDYSLELRIVQALRDVRVPELASLDVHVHQGEATLTGSVSTFHQQLIARSTIRRVPGVVKLVEQIELAPPSSSRGYATSFVRQTA